MKKFFTLFLLTLLVSACATLNTEYKGNDRGYVVMSFLISNHDAAGDYVISYENEEGESGRFFYRKDGAWGSSERDFDDNNFNGRVELYSLKAGTYKITKYEQMHGTLTFRYEDFTPYTFEVLPEQAVYLGELREILGVTGLAKVNDAQDRDIGIAKKKGLPESITVHKSLMNDSMLKLKGSTFIKIQ